MSQTVKLTETFSDWRSEAPCAGYDPDIFFDRAESNQAIAQQAKAICSSCPMIRKCLDTAMISNEEYGIWGGMDPDERRAYRSRWARVRNGGRPIGRTKLERSLDRSESMMNAKSRERHYKARLSAAKECRKRMLAMPYFHRREDLITVLELIIAHPTEDAGSLARRAGYSKSWFNKQKREVYSMCGVAENYDIHGAA